MALLAGRNIAVFAVVATPMITWHLESALTARGWVLRTVRAASPMMARLNALLIVVVFVGALAKALVVLLPVTVAEAQAEFLPVGAAQYLNAEQPPGPIFNSYNWGEFHS